MFEAYQAWQRRLERQSVLLLGREINDLDRQARQELAGYLHTRPEHLAFVTNATHRVNGIARSLRMKRGDEILASDHEYGACDYVWELACKHTGAAYVGQHVPLPVRSAEEVVEQLWSRVTPFL